MTIGDSRSEAGATGRGCNQRASQELTPPERRVVMAYGDFQNEIYFSGLSGTLPTLRMAYHELDQRAEEAMAPSVLSYVAGGAGDERTQRANVRAFENW